MSVTRTVGAMWVGCLLASGCAFNITDISYSSAQFQPLSQQARSFVLTKDVQIPGAPCGFARTLRQQTRWELVGNITEGEVFRSRDQVLTVECSNVFEAYLVLLGERLVGFYLPVEKGFVSISKSEQLPLSW